MDRRHFITTTSAAALAPALATTPAWAQAKTIRLIVPFPAGGAIDVTARVIAEAAKGA